MDRPSNVTVAITPAAEDIRVVDMDELPEPWRTAAERAGVRQSLRGIAEASGLSHPTVRRLVLGGRTSDKTVEAVAGVLRVQSDVIWRWSGSEAPRGTPWQPPDSARLLSSRQRVALAELINAMVEREGGTDGGTSEAGEKTSGGVVAPRFGAGSKRNRMLEDGQPLDVAADDRGDSGGGA